MSREFTFKYNDRVLTVRRSTYAYGSYKQPAILAFDNSDEECCEASGCPYGVLTVNLDAPQCEPMEDGMPFMQFLDINNWPGIEWILGHDDHVDWCEKTGFKMQSGYVKYPCYYWDPEIPEVGGV